MKIFILLSKNQKDCRLLFLSIFSSSRNIKVKRFEKRPEKMVQGTARSWIKSIKTDNICDVM